MAYDATIPADTEFIANGPADIRQNQKALKEDAIVNAGTVNGLSTGNLSGNIPVSNGTINTNLNSEMLNGFLSSAFAMASHVHSVATTSSNGFMANTDVVKLATIASGAEVNQNAFSGISVGSTTIQADSKTDTFTLVGGTNITLTPDAVNDKVTIDVSGQITATKLATERLINGIGFDGSQDITVADSTKVAKSGDTMTGALLLFGNPTDNLGAATKQYSDLMLPTIVESTGYGSVSGSSSTISGLIETVQAQNIHMQNGQRISISQTTVSHSTADSTNPRIDLTYLSSAGIVTLTTGNPSATPVVPTLPSGAFSISNVSVAANSTVGVITDTRKLKTQYNYENMGWINAKYPPVPMVACKGNANYFHSGAWYEDSAYTILSIDDSTAINNLLSINKDIYFPQGNYYHTLPINLTARNNTSYAPFNGKKIWGAGTSLTVFRSCTGIYPAIDLTGSSKLNLRDFRIIADNGDTVPTGQSLSKIGILDRRGSSSSASGFCAFNTFDNILINLGTDSTANGGIGTIGLFIFGGEHCGGRGIEIYANMPMVVENVLDMTIHGGSEISTDYETPATTSGSCTMGHFDTFALISYDSFRALHLYQVGTMEFISLYTSTRKISGTINGTAESIYLNSANNIIIHAYQETSGIYGTAYWCDHSFIKIGTDCINNNINIERTLTAIAFTTPTVASSIINSISGTNIKNSVLNCHFSIGGYTSSSDNIQMAARAISGSSIAIRESTFIMDATTHNTNFLASPIENGSSVINCKCINWYSGQETLKGQNTIQSEEVWLNCTSGQTIVIQTFTFPKSYYSTPIVLATITGDSSVGTYTTGVMLKVSSISTTSFTLTLTVPTSFNATGSWGINIISIGEIA